MPGPITNAQITSAVGKFLASTRYTLQERPGVVKSSLRNETLPMNAGTAYNVPKFGVINTAALTSGVDMTQAQQITDSNLAITPAEFGAQVVLTDLMMDTVRDEFFAVAGRVLADSFDRQQDQTLCDDFSSITLGLGSAGTALAVGHAMAGHASVKYNAPADATAGRGGEPAPDPITLIITPSTAHALKKSMSGQVGGAVVMATGGTAMMANIPDQTQMRWSEQFEAGGTRVKTDINLSKDTSDDVIGGLFSQEYTIVVELGGGPSAENERDASLRAWEVNFVGRWARGIYLNAWARKMTFDSALPTS